MRKSKADIIKILDKHTKIKSKRYLKSAAKKLGPSEYQIQVAVINWIKLQKFNFGLLKKPLALKDYAWHTPNGGSRNKIEAVKLKKAGVLAGVPDIAIAIPNDTFHAFYLEIKTKLGRPSESQIKFAENMKLVNNYYCIAYSVDEAIEFIKAYLGDMLCTAR